jgi:hypothetical protein
LLLFRRRAALDRKRSQVIALCFRFRETLVAGLYGLRTIGLKGVPSGGGVSILSYGLFYELALHWRWVSGRLREGIISHQQNNAS